MAFQGTYNIINVESGTVMDQSGTDHVVSELSLSSGIICLLTVKFSHRMACQWRKQSTSTLLYHLASTA